MIELKREIPKVTNVDTELQKQREELRKEAAERLGYPNGIVNAALKAREVFAKLGIQPFDKKSVLAYKQKKEKRFFSRGHCEWFQIQLSSYEREIPEFALSRALELHKELPSAEFYVDELEEKISQVRSRYDDPFLFMVYGKESYYLDVWDEPEFEQRRVI